MEQDLIVFIENTTGFRRHPITDAIREFFNILENQNRVKTDEQIQKIRENIEEINRLIG
jgi:hypothetical protein